MWPSVVFNSDTGHDNQERSFLALRDETTKERKPDSISNVFRERSPSKKGKVKIKRKLTDMPAEGALTPTAV